MSGTELFVVLMGSVCGYVIIAWVIGRIRRDRANTDENTASHASEATSRSEQGHGPRMRDDYWIRNHWDEVLEVQRHASLEEIKAAFREKIRQYHPDRTEGLAPELRSLAEMRAKELNAAYAWALRDRRAG
jgi:DnaJ-domain-containing protein 1